MGWTHVMYMDPKYTLALRDVPRYLAPSGQQAGPLAGHVTAPWCSRGGLGLDGVRTCPREPGKTRGCCWWESQEIGTLAGDGWIENRRHE